MARRRRSSSDFSVPRRLLRRRRLRWTTLLVLLILLVSALLNRFGKVGYSGDDWETFDQKTFVVADVVDGDTVRIRPPGLLGGDETPVRLIGIDAPEMNARSDQRPDYWAENATEALEDLIEGEKVIVRLEATETRDRYDRLLAYLYTSDGDIVNLHLIEQGHAYADRRFRHTMRSQFEQAENAADRRDVGLWRRVRTHQMPAWRQRWLEERRSTGSNRDDNS